MAIFIIKVHRGQGWPGWDQLGIFTIGSGHQGGFVAKIFLTSPNPPQSYGGSKFRVWIKWLHSYLRNYWTKFNVHGLKMTAAIKSCVTCYLQRSPNARAPAQPQKHGFLVVLTFYLMQNGAIMVCDVTKNSLSTILLHKNYKALQRSSAFAPTPARRRMNSGFLLF